MRCMQLRYGTCAPKEPAEIVSLRVTVLGEVPKPPKIASGAKASRPPKEARRDDKPIYFREAAASSRRLSIARDGAQAGNRITGPALIEEYASTTVIGPDDTLTVDGYGQSRYRDWRPSSE